MSPATHAVRWQSSGRAVAGVLVVLIAAISTPARAQGESADSAQRQSDARARYEAGTQAYNVQDFAAALAEFRASYELFPTSRALFSIGLCQYELDEYLAAREALRRYLEEGGDAVPAERRAVVDERLASIAAKLATLAIEVNEAGAAVLVDGRQVGVSPLVAPVEVDPGDHIVEARMDGHQGEPGRVTVTPGGSAVVRLELASLPGVVRVDSGGVVADVSVDGEVLGATPVELALPAGDHEVLIAATGYRAETRAIALAPGAVGIVSVVLVPLPVAPEAPPVEEEEGLGVRYWWLWTTIGVLVAGGAVTAGVLLWPEDAASSDWSWRMR